MKNKRTKRTGRPAPQSKVTRQAEAAKERDIREIGVVMENATLRAGFKLELEKRLKNVRKYKGALTAKRYIRLMQDLLGFIRDLDAQDFKRGLKEIRRIRREK